MVEPAIEVSFPTLSECASKFGREFAWSRSTALQRQLFRSVVVDEMIVALKGKAVARRQSGAQPAVLPPSAVTI